MVRTSLPSTEQLCRETGAWLLLRAYTGTTESKAQPCRSVKFRIPVTSMNSFDSKTKPCIQNRPGNQNPDHSFDTIDGSLHSQMHQTPHMHARLPHPCPHFLAGSIRPEPCFVLSFGSPIGKCRKSPAFRRLSTTLNEMNSRGGILGS